MKKLSLAIFILLILSCSNSDKQIKKNLSYRNNLIDLANIVDSLVGNISYIGFLDTFEYSLKNEGVKIILRC
jgi:hypothetical protein